MKRMKKSLIASIILLAAFILWTIAIELIDVRAIGPQGSSVGFAGINGFFHNLTGVNFSLYTMTDWLELIPLLLCVAFGALGLFQWIKRKSICKVDPDILILGGFYIITIASYLLFENIVINYRPVLIEGCLETSYPSSTTLLVLCVMPTAMMQFNHRIKNSTLRKIVIIASIVYTAFMVIGRLISGVHWITDIIGGCLLSGGLVALYCFISKLKK